MYILGMESSCDETSASVVEIIDEKPYIRSNIVASQISIHKLYGGVVPEIASRAHIEAVSRITHEALDEAGIKISDLGAIAVTSSPGLIGALLVGVNFAKSLAYANNIPLVPVDHIKGHVAASYFADEALKPPFLALVVSGGHTSIYHVKDYTEFDELGTTRDDAAGEAFDKIARVMGMPYPGGAALDKLAYEGDPKAIKFPSPALHGDNLDFSFSGLKTSALNYINSNTQKGIDISYADVAASYTDCVVKAITSKVSDAIDKSGAKYFSISGGVAANSHLRSSLSRLCERKGVKFAMPEKHLCGDNGAMIALAGYYEYKKGNFADTYLNACAYSPLD